MKEKKTVIKEFDESGLLIRETTITEKEDNTNWYNFPPATSSVSNDEKEEEIKSFLESLKTRGKIT